MIILVYAFKEGERTRSVGFETFLAISLSILGDIASIRVSYLTRDMRILSKNLLGVENQLFKNNHSLIATSFLGIYILAFKHPTK